MKVQNFNQNKFLTACVQEKIVSEDQARILYQDVGNSEEKVYLALFKHQVADPKKILEFCAKFFDVEILKEEAVNIFKDLVYKIPERHIVQHQIIPYKLENDELKVLVSFPRIEENQAIVRLYFSNILKIKFYLILPQNMETLLSGFFKSGTTFHQLLDNVDSWLQQDSNQSSKAPAIEKVFNYILEEAVTQNASDIHFEPNEQNVHVRFRIDGVLQSFVSFHLSYWAFISGRIKVLANMNTAEKRRPQSGGVTAPVKGQDVDLRVSSHPTVFGESLVIRILMKHNSILSLESLGISGAAQTLLKKAYSSPQGLIIFTGPTGSGKTTTLYAILEKLNGQEKNIMTLEDPVEYQLPHIRQTRIIPGVMDFKDGVRSILRQDPDVILIGEVRDEETARMALRSAQTGHLVFTTLHTRNIQGVKLRLEDLGISQDLMYNNLVAIVGQRLVRKVCEGCVDRRYTTPEEKRFFSVENVATSKGCSECQYSGYKGRTAVSEVLYIPPDVGALHIAEYMDSPKNYLSFDDSIIEKIQSFETTVEEVQRHFTLNLGD